jgi:hypothetical protein
LKFIADLRPQKNRIGYFTLDNATNNDTAVNTLADRYSLNAHKRHIRCAFYFIRITIVAMLYNEESKEVQMKDLFDDLNSATAANYENNYAKEVIRGLKSDNYSDALNEDEHNKENDDITANVAGGALTYITAKSLNRYRKDGPFGKLHNIGLHFRQNSQLLQAFRNAQQPCKTLLTWIHNIAIRWSLDYAMATRALELRVPLTRLFADIEAQAPGGRWREFLGNKIEPQEWRVIMVLQRILKDFDVACKQLQGNRVFARAGYEDVNESVMAKIGKYCHQY